MLQAGLNGAKINFKDLGLIFKNTLKEQPSMNDYIGIFDTTKKNVPKDTELSYGGFVSALCKISVIGGERMLKAIEDSEKWYAAKSPEEKKWFEKQNPDIG